MTSFREIKNSILSGLLLILSTIAFLFIVFWLFGKSFFRETIGETISFSYIIDNIGSLAIVFFIVLAYIIIRGTLEVREKKEREKLDKQPQSDLRTRKQLNKEWLFYKIILFIAFLIIMIVALAFIFVLMPLYKIGIEGIEGIE